MEFKKINDKKFQCLLYEEDLEENNITLDDFFRNDTEKIHSLLEVIMQEAEKSIGVMMTGAVMSLQLAPQPNHTLLLTVSTGSEDFGNILKQAEEAAIRSLHEKKLNESMGNVIKKDTKEAESQVKVAPPDKDCRNHVFAVDSDGNAVGDDGAVCRFVNIEDLESFCTYCTKTWGIKNALYKDAQDNSMYLVMQRTRCSKTRFEQFINEMMEYGDFIGYSENKLSYIYEHYELYIADNAVNLVKKYCLA